MKKLLWLIFSGLIPLSFLFLALYLFDPFQLYHKPYFRKPIFNSNMHYQAAGIINNYDFDSIILGSSIMVNTSSKEASSKLRGTWVNLSVSGGGIAERIAILKHSLRKQKIQNLIFTLEPGWLKDEDESKNCYGYLYDSNPLNDFKTYLDKSFIGCFFISKICLKGEESMDRPSQFFSQDWFGELLGGFSSWIKNANRPDTQKILHSIANYKPTVSSPENHQPIIPVSLFQIIEQNPNIDFIFIIPPFSRLSYKLSPTYPTKAIKSLLQKKFSNVKVYGFDNTSIPDDLSRYVDLVHYDEKVNSFMIDAIKNDTHRITLENINSYFKEMQKKVEDYDIHSLQRQIKESGVLQNQ